MVVATVQALGAARGALYKNGVRRLLEGHPLPHQVALFPRVLGKCQEPLERPVLKEGPPEETPCLSASPDKMWRQKGP